MFLILSSPPVTPPAAADLFPGYVSEWIFEGRTWNLNDWQSGVFLDTRGVEGLHNPVVEKFASTARGIHGKRRRGWRASARDVFWPVQVFADRSTDEWLVRQREFFNTIRPDREGVWRVSHNGRARTLRLTGVFNDSYAYELDPLREGWAPYGVALEADQPFWEGDAVTRGPWKGADAVNFYGGDESGATGATPFYLSAAETLADATMSNPGDVDAYPVWTIDGDLDDIQVGVGDVVVEPANVDAGKRLVIDTDPRNTTALLGDIPSEGEPFTGADVTAALGFQSFAPIPPGGSVPIHVEGVGAGSVTCTLTPLYFRAF